jgi:outer membrane protein TolC
MATQGHPALEAAAHAVRAAEARTSQTRTAWIPRVKVEAGYMLVAPVQELVIEQDVPLPAPLGPQTISIERDIGSLHNFSAGVSAGWRVFEMGARLARTDAAEALERAAQVEAAEQTVQIAHAVRSAYQASRFAEEVETVTKSSLDVAQSEQRNEEIKRKAGIGNDLDLARVQMRVAKLDAQLHRAAEEKKRFHSTLRLLLSLKPTAQLVLTDDLKTLGIAATGGPLRPEQHPTTMKIAARAQAVEHEHERLWRTYWPTIDIMGSVKYQYPKSAFDTEEAGVIYTAGAFLTWTVFDGDLIRRKRNETEAKLAALKATSRAADTEIARKQADAEAQMRIAESDVEAAERTLEAAEVYHRAAQASLDAGTGTALEVSQAADKMDQARLGSLRAYLDSARGRAAYLLALGKTAATSTQEARR